METLYCPYCNKTKTSKFTNEHFIPQLIGGENSPTIKVCSDCNSILGNNVDILLAHHSFLIGLSAGIIGRPISRHTKVETEAELKDGRILTGYLVFETVDAKKRTFRPNFIPHRIQEDGTKWIYERGIKDPNNVPKSLNIFKDDMWRFVTFLGPTKYRDKSIPALIKILMGFICWDVLYNHNEKNLPLLKSNFFNVIRDYAFLKKEPRGNFSWIDDISLIQPPIKVDNFSHFFSYSYKEGAFHGLGFLYGRAGYTLVLNSAPYFEGNYNFFELDGNEHDNYISDGTTRLYTPKSFT